MAVVALLAGFLMIVAAGVGGGSHLGRGGRASPTTVRIIVDAGLGVVTAVGLAVAGLLVGALWLRRKGPPPEQRVYRAPPVPWALRLAMILFVLLLGAGVTALLRGAPPAERPTRPAPPTTGELPPDQAPPVGKPSIGPDAAAVAGVAAVTLLGLITAALVARQARRRQWAATGARPMERRSTAPVPAGEISVDDLLGEDPRRAVVAAYARMERVLAAAGVARHPSDAPFEYLSAVRRALPPAGPPTARLTELFERAKFSAAAVDRAMQADAVAALRTLVDDRAVPA